MRKLEDVILIVIILSAIVAAIAGLLYFNKSHTIDRWFASKQFDQSLEKRVVFSGDTFRVYKFAKDGFVCHVTVKIDEAATTNCIRTP